MRTMPQVGTALLVIDLQTRLMPAIAEGARVVTEAQRLVAAAGLLGVRVVVTEQNPGGLGATVGGLVPEGSAPFVKMSFDACRMPGFEAVLGVARSVVVAGCEAHVCVLQTVLGLLDGGRQVFVVGDAVGSRSPGNRDAALRRMERHGAEIVTAEMVVFEWLGTADHERFREAVRLVK